MASGINLTNLSSIFNRFMSSKLLKRHRTAWSIATLPAGNAAHHQEVHMQTDKNNKARKAISNSCLKASLVFTPQKWLNPVH